MTQTKNKKLDSTHPEWWSERYLKEGSIWGEEPSITAIKASEKLVKGSRVVVVGSGYGRELSYLLKLEFIARGVEPSKEAVRITEERLKTERLPHYPLINSNFENQEVCRNGTQEAIIAHRVLHLVVEPEAIKKWVEMAVNLLVPNGKIFIGNRDVSNTKNGSVKKVKEKVFESSKRPGHILNLWTEKDFIKYFGPYFEDIKFERYTEPETLGSSIGCNILLMSATKKG